MAFYAVARAERRLAGDRINQLSRDFVAAQQRTIQELGVRSWQDVPLDLRNKLLNDYKKALSEVQVYHAGSIRPSQQIPYGR